MLFTLTVPALASHVSGIFRRGVQEQMSRIHACPHVAPVAHHDSCGNFAPKQLPRHPMRCLFPVFKARGAISVRTHQPRPFPASVRLVPADFAQKAFPYCQFHWECLLGNNLFCSLDETVSELKSLVY